MHAGADAAASTTAGRYAKSMSNEERRRASGYAMSPASGSALT
jgi:hypothetical protein